MKLNDTYFLNPAHLEIAKARYFLKDDNGQHIEQDIDEVFNRVVNYIYQNDPEHKEEALRLRREKKIIDAGRPLAQAGTKTKNMYNCFVLAFDDDTREAISETKRKHFAIQAAGGGVGINFSKLRPNGAVCKSTQSRSSGATGFITDFSYQSSNVAQGGNRSGANMGVMEDWHPDLYEFITKKSNSNWENMRKFASITDEAAFADFQWNNPHQWQMFNVSVFLTDDFMNRVINHDSSPWPLRWGETPWGLWDFEKDAGFGIKKTITVVAPDESTAKHKALSQIPYFNAIGIKLVKGPYDLSAPEWFDMICKNAWEDGCPGVIFSDLVRRFHNGEYFNKIEATNPCFAGDQLLFTESGIMSFGELYNSEAQVKIAQDTRVLYVGPEQDKNNPEFWAVDCSDKRPAHVINQAGRVVKTQQNADIVKVVTKEGICLRVTPDHHIATPEGMIEARNLVPGQKVLIANTKIFSDVDKESDDYNVGFLYGHYLGDGNFHKNNETGTEKVILGLWGKDRDLRNTICEKINVLYKKYEDNDKQFLKFGCNRYVAPYYVVESAGERMRINSTFLQRLFVSKNIYKTDKYNFSHGDLSYKNFYAGLLSGLIATDGTISHSAQRSGLGIRISSVVPEMLQKIQLACLQFGIYGKIYKRRGYCTKKMPDGHGGTKEYNCQPLYEIIFTGKSRDVLYNIVDLYLYKKEKYDRARASYAPDTYNTSWFAHVDEVIDDGKEDVYCLNETLRRTVVVNGVVARRCAEEPLPARGVCCLTSLVLPSFFVDGEFNYDEFGKAIDSAVRSLDNIIDLNKTGEQDIDENSLNERRIGLGTTGVAELLLFKKLKYSSNKGREFVARILEFMRDRAYRASISLAKERGAFKEFRFEGYSRSEFFKTLPQDIQDDIKEHGIRNVTIITQAPTGSTGTMVGFAQGCEPYFAMCFNRNSRVGSFMDGSPAFIRWLKDNEIDYKDCGFNLGALREKAKVPEYFEEAHEISWMDHLKMQAIFAKYNDSSVSKTINLPNEASMEDVKNAYLAAYKMGVKSTTIYRDGSKQQILEHIQQEAKTTRPSEIVPAHAPSRPVELPCDIHNVTVKGEAWTVLVGLMTDKPYEVFAAPQEEFELSAKYKSGKIVKGGAGKYHLDLGDFKLKNISSYLKSDERKAITRLLSVSLRHGVPVEFITDQLAKADGTVVDFSKAILRVLKKYDAQDKTKTADRTCSKCGSTNVVVNSGCPECLDCGTSKCG